MTQNRFVAQINGGDYINIPADEMKLEDGAIIVSYNGKLVAYVDIGVILTARMSEKEVTR